MAIARVERRIRHILVAWCGDTITDGSARAVDVMTTPVEQLFPLELAGAASLAYCSGLIVDGHHELGPVYRSQAP